MRKFTDFGHLNSHIAFAVRDVLVARGLSADFGMSNVSESAYVNVSRGDDDSDLKLRFSGHDDRHGADRTFRTDEVAVVMYSWDVLTPAEIDEDGEVTEYDVTTVTGSDDDRREAGVERGEAEFSHIEIEDDALAAVIAEAVDYAFAETEIA